MSAIRKVEGAGIVQEVWGELEGTISVVSPIVDRRGGWGQKLESVPEGGTGLDEKADVYIDRFVKYFGRMAFEGDVRAKEMLCLLLASLYGANAVKSHYAQDLSQGETESVLSGNVVALGGPADNPLTAALLEKLGLDGVFDDEWRLRRLKPSEGDEWYPRGDELDFGMALRVRNPFVSECRYVTIIAGHRQFGTQASAACLLTEQVIAELAASVPWNPKCFDLRCRARAADGLLDATREKLMIRVEEPFTTREVANPEFPLETVDRFLRSTSSSEASLFEKRFGRRPHALFATFASWEQD